MPYTIEDDFKWFEENRARLCSDKGYYGKILAIRDKTVIGVYDSESDAIDKTDLPIGEYLVQTCYPDNEADSIHIHTPGLVAV